MISMLEEYLPDPKEAKADLHYDQGRLAQVDACEPTDPRERAGWLTVRRNILGDLTDRASALVHAWDRVGDELAANAVEELGEHYMHLYKQSEIDLEDARRQLASGEAAEADL
ncbi:hypothetical protein ACFQ0M_48890 [Kitasatospora aburaviensis]|uniref:Uncharacterized protein n=1 Tax=Kitasatospora aburaviensis TaxID=67265 RepID=A0ABW1F3E4_9ACTN